MLDYTEVAFKIVSIVLNVQKGNVVSLNGELHNASQLDDALCEIPFIEEIALAIRKRNAFPVIEISTENLKRRFFSEIHDAVFALPNEYYNRWVSAIDCFIDLGWRTNPSIYNHIPDKYFNEMKSSISFIWEQIQKQNKKILFLGYPTKALADYYSIDYETLKNAYFNGINCDYHQLGITGDYITTVLSQDEKYEISFENRNLLFRFADESKTYVGNYNKENFLILPTGKYERKVKRSTLNGLIMIDTVFYQNKYWKDVQMLFENGVIKSVDFVKLDNSNNILRTALLNSLDEVVLSIGLNEGIGKQTNYYLFDECIRGNISLRFFDKDSQYISLVNTQSMILKDGEQVNLKGVNNG